MRLFLSSSSDGHFLRKSRRASTVLCHFLWRMAKYLAIDFLQYVLWRCSGLAIKHIVASHAKRSSPCNKPPDLSLLLLLINCCVIWSAWRCCSGVSIELPLPFIMSSVICCTFFCCSGVKFGLTLPFIMSCVIWLAFSCCSGVRTDLPLLMSCVIFSIF